MVESRPRPALHEAAILMFILWSSNTQPTHPKLPRQRNGSERDRDSDRLCLTPLYRSTHGGDSLLGSGGRLSLSSLNRAPSRSRCHSRSVRRWVHTRAIRTPIGSGKVMHSTVTCGSGASGDSGGRTPPRHRRCHAGGELRNSAGGGGGSEMNACCDRASACGAGLDREL